MDSLASLAAPFFLAAMVAGCSGFSVPIEAGLTAPTTEAFTRLTSWRPFQSTPQPISVAAYVDSEPPPAVQRFRSQLVPDKPIERQRARRAPPLLSPAAIPYGVIEPIKTLPALNSVSCQTISAPGGRVRMECLPSS